MFLCGLFPTVSPDFLAQSVDELARRQFRGIYRTRPHLAIAKSRLVSFSQLAKRMKCKVDFGRSAGVHRGAESLLRMAAVNPAIGDTMAPGRDVIVKQAFGRVKDVALCQAQITHMLQQVCEIAIVG